MCGICGMVSRDVPPDEQLLRRMNALLQHRGPDDEGYFRDDVAALGHRRLSIIDLGGGHEPLYNEDDSLVLVFNGEIYNFQELRRDLVGRGHRFHTRTDCETILHLYEDEGPSCVERLRGMFAFALWDRPRRRLLLSRDRVGKKPLYYRHDGRRLLFASELKSLLADPAFNRDIDPEALRLYLAFSYIPAPRSIFKQVNKLEPGHTLVWEDGRVRRRQYWRLEYQPKDDISRIEAEERVRNELDEAVRLRLESDVPLGCLLSGGIDSAAAVAFMRRHIAGDLHTFTIGFKERDFSELPLARMVAERFETRHEEYIVEPDAVSVLPEIVWHFDEPFGDSSAVATWYVARMARRQVTVVLNGDGGDESFFGYRRYLPPGKNDFMDHWKQIPRGIRAGVIQPVASLLFRLQPYQPLVQRLLSGNVCSLLPWQTAYIRGMMLFPDEMVPLVNGGVLSDDLQAISIGATLAEKMPRHGLDGAEQMISMDNQTYLPGDLLVKMDRMSMAHGLEARSPFLDQQFMERMARLPRQLKFDGRNLKMLLKQSLRGVVPDPVLDGRKHGFSVPLESWFRDELRDFAREILLSPLCRQRGVLNGRRVAQILAHHEKGQAAYHHTIWGLLNLELWFQTFMDRPDISDGPVG